MPNCTSVGIGSLRRFPQETIQADAEWVIRSAAAGDAYEHQRKHTDGDRGGGRRYHQFHVCDVLRKPAHSAVGHLPTVLPNWGASRSPQSSSTNIDLCTLGRRIRSNRTASGSRRSRGRGRDAEQGGSSLFAPLHERDDLRIWVVNLPFRAIAQGRKKAALLHPAKF
jgi:hypothetical protein